MGNMGTLDSICPRGVGKVVRVMNNATNDQMELCLNSKASRRGRNARLRRKQRAQWWFAQMRQVVDAAMDWRPEPPARPEQVYMTLGS